MTSSPQSASCPDALDLQRWLDADLGVTEAALIADHVQSCESCLDRLTALDHERGWIARVFDDEALATAGDDRRVLAAVRVRLAEHCDAVPAVVAPTGRPWFSGLAFSRWRLAPAGALLALVVLAITSVIDRRPLEASADWVVSEWQVRERAWRTQQAVQRMERYDAETWVAGRQSQRSFQATWFSTVPGAELSITRVTRPSGELQSAMWTRTDGSSGRFSSGHPAAGRRQSPRRPTLTLDPPTADLEAVLPSLPPLDGDALRLWLRLRQWRIRPAEQAAGQAAYLSGQVSSYTTGLGVLIGSPRVEGDRDTYRLSFAVTPHNDKGAGRVMRVVDTFARGSLVLDQRIARTFAHDGSLLEQTTLRLVERRDAQPEELARLMADLDAPPQDWVVVRRTAQDILPEARYMLRVLGPTQPPAAADTD